MVFDNLRRRVGFRAVQAQTKIKEVRAGFQKKYPIKTRTVETTKQQRTNINTAKKIRSGIRKLNVNDVFADPFAKNPF